MNDIALTFREFYLYVIIGGAILGALFGLVPLILGRRRGKPAMGWYGLAASVVAGAFAPLLSLIVVAIFSWLIVRQAPDQTAAPADNADTAGESAPE